MHRGRSCARWRQLTHRGRGAIATHQFDEAQTECPTTKLASYLPYLRAGGAGPPRGADRFLPTTLVYKPFAEVRPQDSHARVVCGTGRGIPAFCGLGWGSGGVPPQWRQWRRPPHNDCCHSHWGSPRQSLSGPENPESPRLLPRRCCHVKRHVFPKKENKSRTHAPKTQHQRTKPPK